MKWRRKARGEQQARVEQAKAGADAAAGEVARSLARQESVREHVVRPLREFAEHNQFAAMIERTLREGYRGEP